MIFLTREDTDVARFAAVQSGASAFLHKSRAAAEVVAAIRDVARGKMLITPRCSRSGDRARRSSSGSHPVRRKSCD
jgi:DNA-binding NarL/FixJ family response regulator